MPEKFPGEVEVFNKEKLEQKFPTLEEEAYKDTLCAFAEKIFTKENFTGYGKTANVYKYPDESTGLCFKHVHNLLPGNHDLDVEIEYMNAAKSAGTKVKVPQPFASIISPMKLKVDGEGKRSLVKDRVLVMEYIKGHTLQEYKTSSIELPENFDAKLFFDELDKYIEELHGKNIYHRDLHDKNVMVDAETGMPAVIDFGRSARSYFSDESEQEIYTSEEVENGKMVKKLLPNDNEYAKNLRTEYQEYLTR